MSVPDGGYARAFRDLDVEVAVWPMDGPAPRRAIDMVAVPEYREFALLERLDSVEPGSLVQLASIGYDGAAEHAPAGFAVANAAGVREAPTAEFAVGLIVAALRGIHLAARNQTFGSWNRLLVPAMAGSTALIVGTGGVGRAIADRLVPFGVDILRVARSEREDDLGRVHSREDLGELLPRADVVVIAVPLDDATRRMVDDSFLGSMRDGALFVNIARGEVADTDALVRHAGRIRLALDVVDPEPLPADHPLWQAADLLTPHMAGLPAKRDPRLLALLRRQAEHLVAGEAPENVVLRT